MSEFSFVEKPFLDQLSALGWTVIDQGPGIPTDPGQSLRAGFRQVTLRDVFNQSVRAINTTIDGQTWLTDKQLDDLHDALFGHSANFVERNEANLNLLFRSQVDANELTGEQFPNVKLIDFAHPGQNQFHAINQFRIDTPGATRGFIIPDIVLFVNGLPLVVIECKEANVSTSSPMFEAFQQLMRYSDQREETRQSGLREGEPKLFFTNQLLIRTSGEQADIGTITSIDEEFFFPWRDIYPEKYRTFTPPLGLVRAQETLIQGVLPPETLLDMIRTCSIFMDVGKVRVKVVARYQQYRAVCKIIDRLRTGKTPSDRSGVVWHTQGSGKSLTMVFVIRKLRMCEDLKDYKVCLVNDRTDLEEQLGKTAALTREEVTFISSSKDLKEKLATDSSNLNMVMLHKFNENPNRNLPDYLEDVIDLPKYESFGVVNKSERILLLIDEAHRSQTGDLGDNLFEAFPQATRLAFTGTPLIVVKEDKKKTVQRFGTYIDKYRLQDAVDDKVTVQILYEGKTADSAVTHKSIFDEKINELAEEHIASQIRKDENIETLRKIAKRENRTFDDLIKERTAAEILAIKKRWGTNDDLFEAEPRIQEIARDLVEHYITQIFPNGFKAQVVCSSKLAAVRYKKFIDAAVAEQLAVEEDKPIWVGNPAERTADQRANYRDEELCQRIGFLKSAVVVSSAGTNELASITQARKHALECKAVDNFKKKFDFFKPDNADTGIAFLIVCDMLLTGFDAPIEQVMYIDKVVKAHNLLQTIARVNRISKGKSVGYIVDYIGLTDHLKEALSIYAADDQKDVAGTLTDIAHELPVLESRYRRLLNLFVDNGVAEIEDFVEQRIKKPAQELNVLEQAIRCMEDLAQRSNFEVYFKKFLQSMDIILPSSEAFPYRIPAKRFGFLLVKIKERYKDDSLSISGAGEKVRKLIDEHLISLGINPKIPPVELFSPHFVKHLDQNPNPQAKASEMEHAIRKHCKVHFDEDPVLYESLSEKLEGLIRQHKDNWVLLCQHLFELRDEAETGRQDDPDGISKKEAPFYDLIGKLAFGKPGIPEEYKEQAKQMVVNLMSKLHRTIGIVNFWGNPPEVAKLRGELSDLLVLSGIDSIAEASDKIVTEITALAKIREKDILE